jgi:uncharacterized membrane protein (UPF0182 family)
VRVRGSTWFILGIATLALLSTAGQIVGFYTDWLWFREVQFTSVFVTVLQTQALLGVVTGAAFFLLLYGNMTLARQLAPREALVTVDDAEGLPSPEVLEPYVRRLTLPVSGLIALFAGWLGTDRLELLLKALNPTPFGVRDPSLTRMWHRQIEARIDQDSFISQQLSLWNQRGSQVIRGNLLVIPIERSLVYVEPLYIAAEKGQLPELKRVIVGFGDRIAMEETLEGAMARVFGGPVVRAGVRGGADSAGGGRGLGENPAGCRGLCPHACQ